MKAKIITLSAWTTVSCHLLFLPGATPAAAQGVDSPFHGQREEKPALPDFGPPNGIYRPGRLLDNTEAPGPTPSPAPSPVVRPAPKDAASADVAKILEGQKLSETGTKDLMDRIEKSYGVNLSEAKGTLYFAKRSENGSLDILPVTFDPGDRSFKPATHDKVILTERIPGTWLEGPDSTAFTLLREENKNLQEKLEASEEARSLLTAQVELLNKIIEEQKGGK